MFMRMHGHRTRPMRCLTLAVRVESGRVHTYTRWRDVPTVTGSFFSWFWYFFDLIFRIWVIFLSRAIFPLIVGQEGEQAKTIAIQLRGHSCPKWIHSALDLLELPACYYP